MLLGAAISFFGAIILVQIIGIGEKETESKKEDKALCINEEVKNGKSIINLKELSIQTQ